MIRQTVFRFVRLWAGLFLCACSTTLALQANLGLSPWDVLHQGLSNTFGITFGAANILVGLGVLAVDLLFRQPIGIGTLCNVLGIGTMVDLLLASGFVPSCRSFWPGLAMLAASLPLMALGTMLYIGSEMGAGPRDSMMAAFAQSPIPVGVVRSSMEAVALVVGWLLGGSVGVGTVVSALGLGLSIQWVFGLFHFRMGDLHHQSLGGSLRAFSAWLRRPRREE